MKMHVPENKNAPLETITTVISHHNYKKTKIVANIIIKDKFESVVVNICLGEHSHMTSDVLGAFVTYLLTLIRYSTS